MVDPAVAESAVEAAPAAAPSPSLETELLVQTTLESRATALERRLRRLAFDLHDGALQELCALATELSSMRRQVVPLVAEDARDRVDGRFDDLQARLVAVDQSLRSLVGSVKGEREPIEALDTKVAREVASLRDETGIQADLEIHGSFADLTESRRIVIFQIVREALSNIREHSAAAQVRVMVVER